MRAFASKNKSKKTFSHKKYYSKITKESEDNLELATWLEYHCKNPIVNEQMSCIRCGDKFWIKKNKLFCKNCKFEVDPLLILWTCTICKKEFRSKVKKYNPLKDQENAIKRVNEYITILGRLDTEIDFDGLPEEFIVQS